MSIEVQGNTRIRRTLITTGELPFASSARLACVGPGALALSCSGDVRT
jgi:hypothetical protein